MEGAPAVNLYILELLRTRRFTRRDFAETARGVCRLYPPLSHELAETAPRWAEAIAPAAETGAQLLASIECSRVKRSTRSRAGTDQRNTKATPNPRLGLGTQEATGAGPQALRLACSPCQSRLLR